MRDGAKGQGGRGDCCAASIQQSCITRLPRLDDLNEGGFLGQIAADSTPLTARQAEWLAKLLKRAGLPSMPKGGVQ
jgi:hypothetical protein